MDLFVILKILQFVVCVFKFKNRRSLLFERRIAFEITQTSPEAWSQLLHLDELEPSQTSGLKCAVQAVYNYFQS